MKNAWNQLKEFFLNNPKAAVGITIVLVICILCFAAPLFTEYAPNARIARPHQAPSAEHVLGTTRMGRDVSGLKRFMVAGHRFLLACLQARL